MISKTDTWLCKKKFRGFSFLGQGRNYCRGYTVQRKNCELNITWLVPLHPWSSSLHAIIIQILQSSGENYRACLWSAWCSVSQVFDESEQMLLLARLSMTCPIIFHCKHIASPSKEQTPYLEKHPGRVAKIPFWGQKIGQQFQPHLQAAVWIFEQQTSAPLLPHLKAKSIEHNSRYKGLWCCLITLLDKDG